MKKFDQSSQAQRLRLLAWLLIKPISTVEARHELDILGVAPHIYELRHHYGYNIKTHWKYALNPGGGNHRIAKYVLYADNYQEEN